MKIKNCDPNLFSFSIGIPYQICLLIIIVFTVYYPTMFAEISLLDDQEAINGLFNLQNFDLYSVFFPRISGGGYYRPLIGLLYQVDRFWWFLDSKIMHFENILMHLVNTLLVYWIATKLCDKTDHNKSFLSLFGAILFALHPINTESINWISGRTDPMACTFILLALLSILIYMDRRKIILLAASFLFVVLGIMAKEVALGFLPALVFLITADETNICSNKKNNNQTFFTNRFIVFCCYTSIALLAALILSNYFIVLATGLVYWIHCIVIDKSEKSPGFFKRFRTACVVIGALSVMVIVFYSSRKAVFVSNLDKIPNTISVMTSDLNYTIELFLGAAGFYVKKFFMPLPLNLAIREVDPLYELFGIICFMGCMFLLHLRRMYSALLIAGFWMLAPAFPLAFGTIAWTAYAERYNYIPSAFWVLGGVGFIHEFNCDRWIVLGRYVRFAGVALLLALITITIQRNMLWRTNLGILKDTVEKSPEFKNARGLYISALVDKHNFEEAEKQYFIANKLPSVGYDERYDLMYASLLFNNKKYHDAENMYAQIEKKTNGKSTALYEAMISYYDSRLFATINPQQIQIFRFQKIELLRKLFALNKSPYTSYRLGQALLQAGDKVNASIAIKTAVETFSSGEPLKKNAETLLNSLMATGN